MTAEEIRDGRRKSVSYDFPGRHRLDFAEKETF